MRDKIDTVDVRPPGAHTTEDDVLGVYAELYTACLVEDARGTSAPYPLPGVADILVTLTAEGEAHASIGAWTHDGWQDGSTEAGEGSGYNEALTSLMARIHSRLVRQWARKAAHGDTPARV